MPLLDDNNILEAEEVEEELRFDDGSTELSRLWLPSTPRSNRDKLAWHCDKLLAITTGSHFTWPMRQPTASKIPWVAHAFRLSCCRIGLAPLGDDGAVADALLVALACDLPKGRWKFT
jgi:hypothetical protein